MTDGLIISHRSRHLTATRPTALQIAPVPPLRATPQREFNPAAWGRAMGMLRVPGYALPNRPRRQRGSL